MYAVADRIKHIKSTMRQRVRKSREENTAMYCVGVKTLRYESVPFLEHSLETMRESAL